MTPTQIKTAIALYKGGLTTRGVARIIGCSQSHAWRCLTQAGVKMRASYGAVPAKRERNAQVVADRRGGLSWEQIGRKHKISHMTAHRICRRDAPELIGTKGAQKC